MNTPPTCPGPDRLQAAVRGDLATGDEAAIVAHLDACARCRAAVEAVGGGRTWWSAAARRLGRVPPPAAALRAAIAAVLADPDPGADPAAGARGENARR